MERKPEHIVEFKGVSFSYNGTPALESVNASIDRGDYVGLIGPNGAGKTTLVKIMLGLLKPTTGNVKLFSTAFAEFRDWHKIGYVPQKATSFDPNFPVTVEEVVAMGRFSLAGIGRPLTQGDRKRIHDVMRIAGIAKLARRHIGELSGGQQQKVFIARALASDPELLVLDEPTTGVDEKSQGEFYQFLHDLNTKHHLTLVLISHDTDTVNKHVTKLLCLNHSLTDRGCSISFLSAEHEEHHHLKRVMHKH